MLTLFGRGTSSNVKKVIWALEELGIDYKQIDVGGAFGGTDTPEFIAMNPNRLVPVIKDGDFVLWESNTILRYLAAKYGKGSLWIEDLEQRMQAEKWMDWTMGTLFEPFKDILFHSIRLAPEKRDPQKVIHGILSFEKGLSTLDRELSQQPFLSDTKLGIGDIVAGVFVYYYYAIDLKRNATFAHVEAWYEKLQQRQAYKKYIMTPIG